MKRPTQEQRILDYMEDGKVMSAAVAAHKLNIYSTFGNCMSRLDSEYRIYKEWAKSKSGKKEYMQYRTFKT